MNAVLSRLIDSDKQENIKLAKQLARAINNVEIGMIAMSALGEIGRHESDIDYSAIWENDPSNDWYYHQNDYGYLYGV